MNEKYQDALRVNTTTEADQFINARLARLKKEAKPAAGEDPDKLERSNVCAWARVWAQEHHGRMVNLFRPPWPPPDPPVPGPQPDNQKPQTR